MKLVISKDGKAECLLCEWDWEERNPDKLHKRVMSHLNSSMHDRILISLTEIRGGYKEYHGPRPPDDKPWTWKTGEATNGDLLGTE
jgi:hypothetical protein